MVDQASVKTPAGQSVDGRRVRINSPFADGVLGNLAELGSDIAGLAELQMQLAAADLKESAGKAVLPVTLLGAGLVVLLAALPVALIGASELVADALGLVHRGWAYLIVAAVASALAGGLAWLGLSRLSSSFATFVRTKEELARNVAWIKTVLANSGRMPTSRRG